MSQLTQITHEGRYPTWEAMQSHARKTLVDHAVGRVHHTNLGECPNEIDGYGQRDKNCSVCSALLALEAE